jgi:hypothetical protein
MINSKVRIKRLKIEADVIIVDKIMTNMAVYQQAPIMNNAPFEVYVGLLLDVKTHNNCPLIQFEVTDIIKVYTINNAKT